MIDGARTRDIQDHNLALYQLSYDHRKTPKFYPPGATCQRGAGYGKGRRNSAAKCSRFVVLYPGDTLPPA